MTPTPSTEAERLGEAIRVAMAEKGISGRDLAERIADLSGQPVNEMWLSRRVTGRTPLVKPRTFAPELAWIAEALGVPYKELTAAVTTNPPGGTQ